MQENQMSKTQSKYSPSFSLFSHRITPVTQPIQSTENALLTQTDTSSDLRSTGSASAVPKLPQIMNTSTTPSH